MDILPLIIKKRDGEALSEAEITALIESYTQGRFPDYQMSAWLMAAYLRGLTDSEVFALTAAMAASGRQLDLSALPGLFIDKHSTGGVGDKTSLAVVPILASAGLHVVKMSGRGLGHTGGTLDKLESIPGMRVQLTEEEILTQARAVGACLCAQTEALVPADRMLYALRDATATVESLPLIAASIMSKKLAAGAPRILLDIKVGEGAFMRTREDARRLTDLMVRIGRDQGRRVVAVLSDMDCPLGRSVGNALEVQEVHALLTNPAQADSRLLQLILHLSAAAFALAKIVETLEEGAELAEKQLSSGRAWQKWKEIIRAQGGDPDAPLPQSPVRRLVLSDRDGFLRTIHARAIGVAAMSLGAGRQTKEAPIEPSAGIIISKSAGEQVARGDRLATLHTDSEERADAVQAAVADAFAIDPSPSETRPLIYETIGLPFS